MSKVHRQAERLIGEGRHILFIGHAGHPEVIGTFGQVPAGSMTLVETVDDVAGLDVPDAAHLAFLTQTTLSVDDTAAIVAALKARFPAIRAPRSEDICYATSNRQAAVKAIAAGMRPDAGDRRAQQQQLAAPGRGRRADGRAGAADRARQRHRLGLARAPRNTVGVTAGASAPELLVREVVDALRARFEVTEEQADHSPERMVFKLPRELVA